MNITVIPEVTEVKVIEKKKFQLVLSAKEVAMLRKSMSNVHYGYELFRDLDNLMIKEKISYYEN